VTLEETTQAAWLYEVLRACAGDVIVCDPRRNGLLTEGSKGENTPPLSELFFPHFADSGGYTTQFILFNGITGRSLNGTIRFFSQSGER
jgi:hypothetical protein